MSLFRYDYDTISAYIYQLYTVVRAEVFGEIRTHYRTNSVSLSSAAHHYIDDALIEKWNIPEDDLENHLIIEKYHLVSTKSKIKGIVVFVEDTEIEKTVAVRIEPLFNEDHEMILSIVSGTDKDISGIDKDYDEFIRENVKCLLNDKYADNDYLITLVTVYIEQYIERIITLKSALDLIGEYFDDFQFGETHELWEQK